MPCARNACVCLSVHPGTVLEPLARSCLGFVKALLCDDFFGQHKNLFVVAAANPYREEEQLLLFVQVSSPPNNNDWMNRTYSKTICFTYLSYCLLGASSWSQGF